MNLLKLRSYLNDIVKITSVWEEMEKTDFEINYNEGGYMRDLIPS